MRKISLKQFEQDIKQQAAFNAQMSFWYGIIYARYVKGQIDYSAAINMVLSMKDYNGV